MAPEMTAGLDRYTDSGNNTYVGLRILNTTHDLLYAEFAELTDWNFENPYFYELFDHKVNPIIYFEARLILLKLGFDSDVFR